MFGMGFALLRTSCTRTLNSRGHGVGIIMARFTVVGMLLSIFGDTSSGGYQTFGREVVNPPDTSAGDAEKIEVRKAA